MFVKNNEGINIMKTIKNRLLAATPLISLLGFLVSGLYLKNWSLGWTFFLLDILFTDTSKLDVTFREYIKKIK